jgi:hypothetical protein
MFLLAVDPLSQYIGPLVVGGVVFAAVLVYLFVRMFLPIIMKS